MTAADEPVLIAYDGSDTARRAVREAAKLFGSRQVLVVTVWEPGLAMAVALLWTWLFQPGFGLFDGVLSWIGVHLDIGWLTDPNVAMPSLVLTTLWWTVGFNFLLYLAALQAIPQDL